MGLFRLTFSAYCLLVVLNPEGLGLLTGGNQIEKVLLAAAGVTLILHRKLDGAVSLAIIGIVCATLVSAVATGYLNFSIDRYLRSLFSLVSVLIMLAVIPTQEDRDFVLSRVAMLPLAIFVFGLFYDLAGLRPLWHTDFLGAPRLQGSSIPAGLGSVALVGAAAALICAAGGRRGLFLTLGVANLALLVLSGARMATALSLPIALLIGFTMLSRNRTQRLSIFGIVVAAVCAFPFLGTSILLRFESTSLSGRDEIWSVLNHTLEQYPMFGIGLGHQITVVPEIVTQRTGTIAAHNEYLRLAVETGYIGSTAIFFCLVMIGLVTWARSRTKFSALFLVIWLSFFVYSLTDNTISSSNSPLLLVIASFAFPVKKQEREELALQSQSASGLAPSAST